MNLKSRSDSNIKRLQTNGLELKQSILEGLVINLYNLVSNGVTKLMRQIQTMVLKSREQSIKTVKLIAILILLLTTFFGHWVEIMKKIFSQKEYA